MKKVKTKMANNPPLLREKDKPKKERKKTTSQLKKELDTLFSRYIRLSYANNGNVSCYTCGRIKPWKEIQCGHFISRSYLATRFLEQNCRPQCVGCNVFGNGKVVEFGRKLEEETAGIVTWLYKEAQKTVKDFPYASEISRYKSKLIMVEPFE